jgi:hypothetical protein
MSEQENTSIVKQTIAMFSKATSNPAKLYADNVQWEVYGLQASRPPGNVTTGRKWRKFSRPPR